MEKFGYKLFTLTINHVDFIRFSQSASALEKNFAYLRQSKCDKSNIYRKPFNLYEDRIVAVY